MENVIKTSRKIVRSSFQRLQWYHKFLFVSGTLAFLGSLVLLYYSLQSPSYHTRKNEIAAPLFLLLLWIKFLFPMIKTQVLLAYEDAKVLFLHIHDQEIEAPFPFHYIQKVVKRSPTCSELYFKEESPLTFMARRGDGVRVRLENLLLNANEADLIQFGEALAQHNVPVLEDPIPDNDPMKQVAIALIGVLSIIAMMLSVFWLLQFVK